MKIHVIKHLALLAVWVWGWVLVGVLAVFSGGVAPAHAQTSGITKVDIPWTNGKTGGTVGLDEIRLQWKFWTLMGEPVYLLVGDYRFANSGWVNLRATSSNFPVCTDKGPKAAGKPITIKVGPRERGMGSDSNGAYAMPRELWEAALPKVELLSTSRFRIFIKDPSWRFHSKERPRGIYFEAMADTLARQNSNDVTFGVPNSPNWDKTFKRSGDGFRVSDDNHWMSAEEAKEMFKNGIEVAFIEPVELDFNMWDLVSAYSGYLNEECKPKEEKKKKDGPPKAQDVAVTKPKLDMSGFSKSAATAAKTASANNTGGKPKLDMSGFSNTKKSDNSTTQTASAQTKPDKGKGALNMGAFTQDKKNSEAIGSLTIVIAIDNGSDNPYFSAFKRAAIAAVRRASETSSIKFSIYTYSPEPSSRWERAMGTLLSSGSVRRKTAAESEEEDRKQMYLGYYRKSYKIGAINIPQQLQDFIGSIAANNYGNIRLEVREGRGAFGESVIDKNNARYDGFNFYLDTVNYLSGLYETEAINRTRLGLIVLSGKTIPVSKIEELQESAIGRYENRKAIYEKTGIPISIHSEIIIPGDPASAVFKAGIAYTPVSDKSQIEQAVQDAFDRVIEAARAANSAFAEGKSAAENNQSGKYRF